MVAPLQSSVGNTYLPNFRDFQQDEQELKLLLSKSYTEIALSCNYKTNGIYDVVETQNGQQFNNPASDQDKRFAFRKMFNIDPAALTFNHGITGVTQFTFIYGVINTAIDSRPLPYVDVVNVTNQTAIRVTATQVIITNGATAQAITGGIVVLEYLKN